MHACSTQRPTQMHVCMEQHPRDPHKSMCAWSSTGRDHKEVAVWGIFEVILHLLLTNEDNKERMYNIAMKDNLISTPIHL